MALTPDQKVAETLANSVEAKIYRLQQEDDVLANALQRRADIAAELGALQLEKARIDPRRPPGPSATIPPPVTPATPAIPANPSRVTP